MSLVTEFYRRREGLRWLVRELSAAPGAVMLDVGCRRADVTRALAREKRFVVAVDLTRFPEWLDPHPRIRFASADATALPFRDAAFDLVVSSECLQYVGDWRGALDEFHRVLKPGGRLVLSCPNGTRLTDGLDPYNLAGRVKRRLHAAGAGDRTEIRHVRPRELLAHRPDCWECERFLRRGSLAFIYAAFLIDNLQHLRVRWRGTRTWLAEWCVRPLILVLFGVMRLDFGLALGPLSYNAVYRLRKRPPA